MNLAAIACHLSVQCCLLPGDTALMRADRTSPKPAGNADEKDLGQGTGKVAQSITSILTRPGASCAKVDCIVLRIPRCSYASEPQVVGPRADLALAACADHVSRTILVRAEEGSPTLDLLLLPGLQWIVGVIRALRIVGNAARLG